MGDILFRAPKAVARDKHGPRANGSRWAETDPYNRSSLAVDFDREPAAETPAQPQVISWPENPNGGVPQSALWKGQDPFAEKRGLGSRNASFFIHVVVIGGVLAWGMMPHNPVLQPLKKQMVFKLYAPDIPPVKPTPKPIQGGGGGGEHKIIEPRRGHVPKPVKVHLLPPEIAQNEKPTIPEPPSINANLPQNTSLPKLGMPKSPQIAVASEGSGSNGFGIGMAGGMGAGKGNGAGAGQAGGHGGGVMNVGGGVSAPQVIHSVEPEFTPQARAADYQGTVSIQLIVDPQGNPQDIHVVRHLGMGLDQKAVEAVRQYKFRPAMYQGHPVAVQMIIEVSFHLH